MVSDMQQQQASGMQPPQKPPQVDSQFIKAFVAGGGAGMLAALVTCPVEVVKTKLQVLPPFHLPSTSFGICLVQAHAQPPVLYLLIVNHKLHYWHLPLSPQPVLPV